MPRETLSGNHCAVSVDAGSPRTVFETTIHSSSGPPFRHSSLGSREAGACVKPLGVLLGPGGGVRGVEDRAHRKSRAVFLELSFLSQACVDSVADSMRVCPLRMELPVSDCLLPARDGENRECF